jgi:hypothetical protein
MFEYSKQEHLTKTSIIMRDRHMLHNDYDRKGSVKKTLAVNLKGLGAKMK